jgi:hypothetical protein
MVRFDIQQLHTFWNALYGGASRGSLSEVGQDVATLLQHLNRVARGSTGYGSAQQLNAPLDGGEVEAALKKLHCGRAPGPDGLRAEHLRHAYLEINLENGKVLREYTF